MDASVLIALLTQWVTHMFPSTAEYAAYIGPGLMMLVTGFGIFTNLLPEPGHKYPIPDVTALEAELQGNGSFILKIAKFARALCIGFNWFLAIPPYRIFYNTTNAITGVLSKVKLAPKPAVPSKPADVSDPIKVE